MHTPRRLIRGPSLNILAIIYSIKNTVLKSIKVIPHEGYYFNRDFLKKVFIWKNDIALVKIDSSSLNLKDKLMPICLPDANVNLTKECYIAGFGYDNGENGN